jgi:hypothetical protein
LINNGRIYFDGPKTELFKDTSILDKAELETPRIMRYALKLKELEYIENANIYSIEQLKRLISV